LFTGARRPPHFTEPKPPAWDAWDAKGTGEVIAGTAFPGSAIELRPTPDGDRTSVLQGLFAPQWEILVDGAVAGTAGEVSLDRPAWASPAFGVELTLQRLGLEAVAPPGENAYGRAAAPGQQAEPAGEARVTRYRPIPAYPASWVDVTLLVPDTVAAGRVEEVLRGAGDALLERYQLVSEFRGEGVPTGHRSLTWRLTFRDPMRTLVEKQVEARRDKLLRALETELGVRPRTT